MRFEWGSLLMLSTLAWLGCGGASPEAAEPAAVTSEPEVEAASTSVAPPPATLTPATPEEVAACREETSQRSESVTSGDYSEAAVVLDRTHLRDDMMLLCDAPSAVPTCFHDGRDNATTLDCVMAHYLCRLRSHHARAALSALPGADRSSKATILRYATRQAGLTECALADVFDLP
ncbi:MAG: hypothetical protein IPG81_26355 [Sandaracinaceae bacterium]|nr:hypothetical protein [Sandaracinaceae bacterium]MBK8592414.1 hypothetical protein [Sandaracinaceae bacterium]